VRSTAFRLATLLVALFPTIAFADVTVRWKTVTSGMGGFADGVREHTLMIAGDSSRVDEAFTSAGRTKPPGARRSSTIMRFDREVVWRIDADKKQYAEFSFAALRPAAADSHHHDHGDTHGHDEATAFASDLKRTGKKQVVNGFAAEQVLVTLKVRPKDPQSRGVTTTFTLEQWRSVAVPSAAELRTHDRRMAERLGADPELQRIAGAAMVSYGGPLRALAGRLKTLAGYPVRTTLTIASGGAAAQANPVRAITDLTSVTAGVAGASFELPEGFARINATASPADKP
jgi:hypothetical protein